MSNPASLPSRIEVFALWTRFASPPQSAGLIVIQPDENGDYAANDEVTHARCYVSHEHLVRLMTAIDDISVEPEPARFGRSAEELNSHFGSCTTDDSQMMLVELHFDDRELLRIKSSSNRAHLLPFMVERNDGGENYNPEISIALAEMLPDGSMFRERLQSADRVFDSERELRAEFAKYDRKTGDRPQETNEQHMEKINATLNDMADSIDHGDDVEFAQGKRDYNANQLRTLSATELSDLVADGFDLSTSDETGQTALMLSAFPPFSRDQFEKLVSAGADVNARRADSMEGLMLACSGGMEDTVQFWLDAGANVNLRGASGCTAIMLGAKHSKIVQRLLERGADVAATDNGGDTALDYAIDDQSIMRAGSRLKSIELVARELSRVDASSLKRSLDHAIEIARKTRVHHQVLTKLGLRPVSENLLRARKQTDQSKAHQAWLLDMEDLIDLEITEIELADRIVALLREVVAEAKE